MVKIKFNNLNKNYSILIGNGILNLLPKKIKLVCPRTKKIALIFDKALPPKYRKDIIKILTKYEIHVFNFMPSEKTKSLKTVNFFFKQIAC